MVTLTVYASKDMSLLTNRWSSRLRGRSEQQVRIRKEPRTAAVVGGAAQLYVKRPGFKK